MLSINASTLSRQVAVRGLLLYQGVCIPLDRIVIHTVPILFSFVSASMKIGLFQAPIPLFFKEQILELECMSFATYLYRDPYLC